MQKAAREASIPLVVRLVTERSLEDALTDRLASDGRRKPLFLIRPRPVVRHDRADHESAAPVVLVNGVDPSMQLDSIAPSNFYGGRLAADILLGLGHRSILYVTSLPRWTTSQRCLGFQLRIEETVGAGLDIVQLAEPTQKMPNERWRRCSPKDWRWSAVFCMNDLYAIGVLEALQRHGMKVPGDVSLIGFDDLPFAAMVTPRLSTFQVDSQALGSAAIQLMLRRLADPSARPLQTEVGVRAVEGGTLGRFEGDNRSGPTNRRQTARPTLTASRHPAQIGTTTAFSPSRRQP